MSSGSGKMLSSGSADATEAIKAHGDVATKKGVLWIVGAVLAILALGGVLSFFFNPDKSKDLWVIIGPIIAAGITAVASHLTGGKAK